MNSKEALKRLYYDAISLNEIEEDVEQIKNDYDLIKQDLDRLEQLEKENQGLKKVRDNYSDQLNYVWNIVNSLKDENTRLKQALEKIKELPHCDICDANWHKGCLCLQKNIKKVFESVGEE